MRVAVRAAGVNPVDWKMKAGGGPLRLAHRLVGPSGPFVVGVDFAGDVVEVGEGVTERSVGDRVVGGTDFSRGQFGSYATEVIVRPDQCALLPESVSYDAAACLPIPGATAWNALVTIGRIRDRRDARVLVLGASGGVGLVAIQLARVLGAHATGICSSRNVDLVARLGASPIDYSRGDPLVIAREHGVYDVIVNAVGSATYPNHATRSLLAPNGKVVLVVVGPRDYPAIAFMPGIRTVLGRPNRLNLSPLVDAMARGELEAVVDSTFSLSDAEAAHDRSRTGKVVGKVLLHP